jgi:hypothetical protein
VVKVKGRINVFKEIFKMLIFAVLFYAVLLVFSGCKSNPEINRSLIEHSRAVERSQNAQRELISIIDRAEIQLIDLERTASLLDGSIERLGILFAEYDSIVREIIEGVNRVQNSLGTGVGNSQGFTDNRGSNNNR